MNFKVYGNDDYSKDLVDKLMFTYRKSNLQILERYYMKKSDGTEIDTEEAANKLKDDYAKFIEEFLENQTRRQFIASIEVENNIASSGRFILLDENTWLLEALETAEQYRKKNLATLLLKNVVIYLKNNCGKKVIANVYKENIPSINFHLKFGFRLNGKLPVDSYGGYSENDEQYEYLFECD